MKCLAGPWKIITRPKYSRFEITQLKIPSTTPQRTKHVSEGRARALMLLLGSMPSSLVFPPCRSFKSPGGPHQLTENNLKIRRRCIQNLLFLEENQQSAQCHRPTGHCTARLIGQNSTELVNDMGEGRLSGGLSAFVQGVCYNVRILQSRK